MPSPLPSRTGSAYLAWTDLTATVSSHPLLAVIAVATCTATSLANAYLNLEEDISTRAIVSGLGLAATEALLLTPVLLASHRFVILGETTQDYIRALSTRRFWRFFLLSAAIVATLFVPILLARWRPIVDEIYTPALYVGIASFVAASLWLSLLFPAIAVDAPSAGLRNAIADIGGNVWRIFWVGVLALLPLLIGTMVVGGIQAMIFEDLSDVTLRLAFAPLEGAMIAATYVLLVLIASRFYLALGDRLRQSGPVATRACPQLSQMIAAARWIAARKFRAVLS